MEPKVHLLLTHELCCTLRTWVSKRRRQQQQKRIAYSFDIELGWQQQLENHIFSRDNGFNMEQAAFRHRFSQAVIATFVETVIFAHRLQKWSNKLVVKVACSIQLQNCSTNCRSKAAFHLTTSASSTTLHHFHPFVPTSTPDAQNPPNYTSFIPVSRRSVWWRHFGETPFSSSSYILEHRSLSLSLSLSLYASKRLSMHYSTAATNYTQD